MASKKVADSIDWNWDEPTCTLRRTELKAKWLKGCTSSQICLPTYNTVAYVSGTAIKFIPVLKQNRRTSILWLRGIKRTINSGRMSISFDADGNEEYLTEEDTLPQDQPSATDIDLLQVPSTTDDLDQVHSITGIASKSSIKIQRLPGKATSSNMNVSKPDDAFNIHIAMGLIGKGTGHQATRIPMGGLTAAAYDQDEEDEEDHQDRVLKLQMEDWEHKTREEEDQLKDAKKTNRNNLVLLEHKGYLEEIVFVPPGQGIGLLTASIAVGAFAFTEVCINPKIYIHCYKTFAVNTVLKGATELDYKAIAFLGKEFFVAISGVPVFAFHFWKWTSKRVPLTTVKTEVEHGEIQLTPCPTRWNAVCQWTKSKLSVWEIDYFENLSTVTQRKLSLPVGDVTITDVAWGPSGELLVASSEGYIFKFEQDKDTASVMYDLMQNILQEDESLCEMEMVPEDKGITSMNVVDNNIIVFTKEGVMFSLRTDTYQVEKEGFGIGEVLQAFPGDKGTTIARTAEGEIVLVSGVNVIGSNFVPDIFAPKFLAACFIRPECTITAGLTPKGRLYFWQTNNGQLEAFFNLATKCTSMACSPVMSYLTIGTEDGNLLVCYTPQDSPPKMVHRVYLSTNPLDKLYFVCQTRFILACNSARGLVYVLSGLASKKFEYLSCSWARGVIQSICDMSAGEGMQDFRIAALVCSQPEATPDRIIIFKMNAECSLQVAVLYNLDFTCRGLYYSNGAFYTYLERCREIGMYKQDPNEENILDLYNLFKIDTGQRIDVILPTEIGTLYFFAADGTVYNMTMGHADSCRRYSCHHFTTGGIVHGDVSPQSTGFLTVGGDGMVTFTDLRGGKSDGLGIRPSRMQLGMSIKDENTAMEAMRARNDFVNAPHELTALQVMEEENRLEKQQQYQEVVDQIRFLADAIRRQVTQLLETNSKLDDNERLLPHEFEMDIEEERRMWTEGLEQIQQTEAEAKADSMARELVTQKLKELCWDRMQVKAQRLKSFGTSLEVPNYQLAFPSAADAERLRTIQMAREIDAACEDIENEHLNQSSSKTSLREEPLREDSREFEDKKDENDEVKEVPTTSTIDTDSNSTMGGSIIDMRINLPSSQTHTLVDLPSFMYKQLQLTSVQRMQQQILIIKDVIRQLQVSFNKQFDQAMVQKQCDMNAISERNVRIRYILNELGQSEEAERLKDPKWTVEEKTERLLEVQPHEILSPVYISPEERKRMEKEAAEEAERRRKEAEDNFKEKALIVMMDGVLEKRREDELKKDIPKPPFLIAAKPVEEWTEEENKVFKDYERRVLELNEEREKYRKQLEAELAQLLEKNKETRDVFDENLQQLFQLKMKYDSCVLQEEITIARLNFTIYTRNRMDAQEQMLTTCIQQSQEEYRQTNSFLTELQGFLDRDQKAFESYLAQDRQNELSFKKDIRDIGQGDQDILVRLYKRRPKDIQKMQRSAESLNHLLEILLGTKESGTEKEDEITARIQKILDEMDDTTRSLPEGMEITIWTNFCKQRRAKIVSETQVKAMAMEMAERRAAVTKKKVSNEKNMTAAKDMLTILTQIRECKENCARDMEIQLVIKQGQTELFPCSNMIHFEDAILVDKMVVEKVNELIKGRGEVKLKAMTRSKTYREGIMGLEWDYERGRMEIMDLVTMLFEVNHMHVTRDMQEFLRATDFHGRQQKNVVKLEECIKKVTEQHEKKVAEANKVMKASEKLRKQKEHQNAHANSNIHSIKVDITEAELKTDMGVRYKKGQGLKRRMKIIKERSKLIRDIETQQVQLLALQKELTRLRNKTLPAL